MAISLSTEAIAEWRESGKKSSKGLKKEEKLIKKKKKETLQCLASTILREEWEVVAALYLSGAY